MNTLLDLLYTETHPMGTLYEYDCQTCGYQPDDELALGCGMSMACTVLIHCKTCRELHLFDEIVGERKPPRCPRAPWHQVEFLEEPAEGLPFRVTCPKCKTVNLMLEVGLWD